MRSAGKMSVWTLFLLCLCVPLISALCPRGCRCTGNQATVSCSNLRAMPYSFPASMTSLSVQHPNISSIPSDIFLKFQSLKTISFQYGYIGKISNGAFRSIPAQRITFSQTNIGTIEPGAFSYLEDLSRSRYITFSYGKIGSIEQYAFYKISGLYRLEIYRMEINTVEPYAFNNIKYSRYFVINYSKITFFKRYGLDLHQKSFESMNLHSSSVMYIGYKTLENLSSVSSLTTWCNCDVIKMVRRGADLTTPVRCFPDNQLVDVDFDSLEECPAPAIPPPVNPSVNPAAAWQPEEGRQYSRKKTGHRRDVCNGLNHKNFKDALSCLKVNLDVIKDKFGLNLGLQMKAN